MIIVMIKEGKKLGKYLDLAQKLKNLYNMLTVILIIVEGLRIISKNLRKGLDEVEIRGKIETIQIIALLKSVRILRRVLGI